MYLKSESGRSMLEVIAVIILLALLLIAGLWGFRQAVLNSRVNTMSKDLTTAITDRRYLNAQGGAAKEHKSDKKVGDTDVHVENQVSDGSFVVSIKNIKADECEEMKKFNIFKPIEIKVNAIKDGVCKNNNDLDFYFDNYGAESEDDSHETNLLHNECDGISYTKTCCDNEYDRNGCLIKKKEPCAPTHQCAGCICRARETCPDEYNDGKCWSGQENASITLENGKVCHKCSGTPLENCYATYKEGTCPSTKIIKAYIELKNGKKCSLCDDCPEGKKPNSEQKTCIDCDATMTCPSCPTEKPYWDEVQKKCIKLEDKEECPPDYKEGNCSSDEIILAKSTLKNTKVCSKCSKCSEGKKPDSEQKTCIDCDATMTCPSCPTEKSYWDATNKACICDPEIYNEKNGKCVCKDEIIIPQNYTFYESTRQHARKEIAHLGPYKCAYEIYVEGTIDDTFYIEDENKNKLCYPDTSYSPRHSALPGAERDVKGILYRLPPNKEITIYAQDIYGTQITWCQTGRPGSSPIMELRLTDNTSEWCNMSI